MKTSVDFSLRNLKNGRNIDFYRFQNDIQSSVNSENNQSNNIIVIRNLRKSYTLQDGREVTVLRNITMDDSVESFPIQRGEFLMIRGHSGSGKTRFGSIS